MSTSLLTRFGKGNKVRDAADVAGALIDGEAHAIAEYIPRGTLLRQSDRRAKKQWYAPKTPGAISTTRQTEVVNTAVIASPTGAQGILHGKDKISGNPVAHDPFTEYQKKDRKVTSSNVLYLGDVGSGKSSGIKTIYVIRPLNMRKRRVVVLDKKDQQGEGEYCELTRRWGSEPLKFNLDGSGTRLNPLDPVILSAGSTLKEGVGNQIRLLQAISEQGRDGVFLDTWEEKALRDAYAATMAERDQQTTRTVPVLADLVRHLGKAWPDGSSAWRESAKDRWHEAGIGLSFTFEALLEELGGVFDGETSSTIKLDDRLNCWDISQLPDDSAAVSMVMVTANTWLLGLLRSQPGWLTNLVVEEGWHLIGGPGARVIKANTKLSRGRGLGIVVALHKGADIPPDSDAMAIIKEAPTVHAYNHQRSEDRTWTGRLMGLDADNTARLGEMDPGEYLLKIGRQTPIWVEHCLSNFEAALTNTDAAMYAGA